jgi:hypothetical protein
MSAVGAKGRQICVPAGVSGNSTFVIDFGRNVIVPRTREMIGGLLISFTLIVRVSLIGSQKREDGPTVNECSVWRRALRPRSVIVKRPPGP